MYCYTSNIPGLTKWVKRHMNRRFRRGEKDRLRKLRTNTVNEIINVLL